MLPRHHPLAANPAVSVAALQGQDLIMRERGSITRRLAEEALAQAGVQPRRWREIAGREAIREAVLRGMGISIFARHEAGFHPDLVALPFIETLPQIVEYLYCVRDRTQSLLIQAFLGQIPAPPAT